MDDLILVHVFGRPRDKFGRLIRHNSELPPWVEVDADGMRTISKPVPFSAAVRKAWRGAGVNEGEVERRWQSYKKANPKLGRGGE